MIRTYTLSRKDIKSKQYTNVKRTVSGEKPTTRDVNKISYIIRRIPVN